jgi:hypothetical protein
MGQIDGALLAESLRTGAILDGIHLEVSKISRADVGDVNAGQPRTWTLIHFRARAEDAERIASALSAVLAAEGGWYCDFRSNDETFVVFAGRIFRYPRGDRERRAQAEAYARSVGVPAAQIDWPE